MTTPSEEPASSVQKPTGLSRRDALKAGAEGMGLDEMNAQIAAEASVRPASAVLAAAQEAFDQLLAVIAACPENILNDPRILGLPDDTPPWIRVANSSYAHYREHEPALQT